MRGMTIWERRWAAIALMDARSAQSWMGRGTDPTKGEIQAAAANSRDRGLHYDLAGEVGHFTIISLGRPSSRPASALASRGAVVWFRTSSSAIRTISSTVGSSPLAI